MSKETIPSEQLYDQLIKRGKALDNHYHLTEILNLENPDRRLAQGRISEHLERIKRYNSSVFNRSFYALATKHSPQSKEGAAADQKVQTIRELTNFYQAHQYQTEGEFKRARTIELAINALLASASQGNEVIISTLHLPPHAVNLWAANWQREINRFPKPEEKPLPPLPEKYHPKKPNNRNLLICCIAGHLLTSVLLANSASITYQEMKRIESSALFDPQKKRLSTEESTQEYLNLKNQASLHADLALLSSTVGLTGMLYIYRKSKKKD